jgi:four helix bundle protein
MVMYRRPSLVVSGMVHRIPVSADDSHDPLSRMRVYQLAGELIPDCYADAQVLINGPITKDLAPDLYAAVCSIESNIAEAYSRSSGKERATRFEYALGSVRESVLGAKIVKDRRDRLEEMRRILLAIIPRERGRPMK